MASKIRTFLNELKRRHVYQVGAAYVVVGLGVLGAAELVVYPLAGEAVQPIIVALVLLGFPLALVLAWAYEVRPEVATESDVATPLERDASRPQEQPRDRRRIAVLPFTNIQANRDQDYFADGMTEELISVISRIQGFDVIARTSVMPFRDTSKGVREIGRELQVGTVLEGSVRKAGNDLRITVQLIDVESQGHLWSQDYDRELREVFRIQSDIARHVAEALEVTLLGAEERRVERAPTESLEAYDLYLLGRHHVSKRSDIGIRRAIEHFEKALEVDPDFAPAYAGLADTCVLAGIGYAAVPDALSRASEAATRALELDPDLAEAHTALGYVLLNRDWDWRGAERELERAIELNPSDAQAYQYHAQLKQYRRRYSEAIPLVRRARELDPLSVVLVNESGWPHWFLRDFEEAVAWFRKAKSMDPSYAMADFNIANCYHAQGRLEEAIPYYESAVRLSNGTPVIVAHHGAALGQSGRHEEARALLEDLTRHAEEGADVAAFQAMIHDGLGNTQRAIEHLELSLAAREPALVFLYAGILPTSLSHDPRFLEIRREVRERLGVEDDGNENRPTRS